MNRKIYPLLKQGKRRLPDKKGASTDYIIKWILAIAIITAVGFAIREIVSKFAG